MRGERGQASLEWIGLVALVCLACGAAVAAGAGAIDGRAYGAELAHAILCAARGDCDDDGDDELAAAYGESDAALVRQYLPSLVYESRTRTLPVDFRECRSHECSDAPDEEGLDVHRASGRGGAPATVFTRLIRDRGETFIQYWLYYPDSTTTVVGLAGAWNKTIKPVTGADWVGHHPDDWESVQVRIDQSGEAEIRASSHHGYLGCEPRRYCREDWTPSHGWSRVSYGSHAGHIPDEVDPDERTTTAAGIRLVPLEGLSEDERGTDFEVSPPWEKTVYRDPRSGSTG